MTIDAQLPAVRDLAGVEVPGPGKWVIDPGHAEVAFIGRHFLLTKVRGRFTEIAGQVLIDADPESSKVEVTIGMDSVTSGSSDRDGHLRSADLFDVATYPEASFRSTAVSWSGSSGQVDGELTIKGVTRSVTLDATLRGVVRDPWDNDRAVFSAATTIDREDWGITWNVPLASGGLLVSKEIRIEVEVELIRD